jgi:hypothetical protein
MNDKTWSPKETATENEVESHFVELINNLMQYSSFMINSIPHKFLELELYYTSNNHPDPYTHLNPEQAKSGYFHFHKAGNKPESKYKGGSYKGLDISVGLSNKDNVVAYGGILVRSIQNMKDGTIIVGPCKCVDYILNLCNVSSIEQLMQYTTLPLMIGNNDRNTDTTNLKSNTDLLNILPLRCSRIGLYLTKQNVDLNLQGYYMKKQYRFVSWNYLEVVSKETKSKISIVVGLLYLKLNSSYIMNILKSNPNNIIDKFYEGCKSKNIDLFKGKSLSTIDEIANCLGYLS